MVNYFTPVEFTDITEVIALPKRFEVFKATGPGSDELPYIKFYTYIANELGKPLKEINVSSVCVSKKVDDLLERYVRFWLKKECSYLRVGGYKFDAKMAMFNLQYGPVVINEDYTDNDNAYIRSLL